MATLYNKKCLDCGLNHIHEYLKSCPICKSTNLYQDLELKNEKNYVKRNKGKIIIDLPSDYTIIDIETTGLMPLCDEIIELSALKVRDNKVIEEFTTLVRPESFDDCDEEDEDDSCGLDEFITELTGITNDMLQDAPSIKDVMEKYINFISNDTVIGYNVNFDINFIYDDYKGYFNKEFSNNYIDLMRICKKICQLPNHKLKTVADYYKVSTSGHHRGLNDCYITYNLYNQVSNDILSKYQNVKEFRTNNWYRYMRQKASDIKATTQNIDKSNYLYDKTCVFTGTLNIPRKDAMQLVVNMGGKVSDTLNKETNILIVGTQDYLKTKKIGKSNKMLKAEEYILKGQDLQIISENEFIELIEEE